MARLAETVQALRLLWAGDLVTFEGEFHTLHDAACTPKPVEPPRIVIGVGAPLALAMAAVAYADELNVYTDESVLARTRSLSEESARHVDVSMFFSWEWDKWPADPMGELARWRDLGVERVFVSLGGTDMLSRVNQIAPLIG